LTLSWLSNLFGTLFMMAVWLGIARLVFLGGLGFVNMRQDARRIAPALGPERALLSVLIPAHNEAMVICSAIKRVLSSDYVDLEVIIVDDGSTDGTSDAVRERFDSHPRVTLLTTSNGGKAAALNRGLVQARGSVIVALDADTQFQLETISKLARWFVNPTIGAVAGNAKVGNRINTITGPGICHRAKPRAARLGSARLHHGRSWSCRRVAPAGPRFARWLRH
jgi:glycosyltransferase involved in cell wall biosynthesis